MLKPTLFGLAVVGALVGATCVSCATGLGEDGEAYVKWHESWRQKSAVRMADLLKSGLPELSLGALFDWNQEEFQRDEEAGKSPSYPERLMPAGTFGLPNLNDAGFESRDGTVFRVVLFCGDAGSERVRLYLKGDAIVAGTVSALEPQFVERWHMFDQEGYSEFLTAMAQTGVPKNWTRDMAAARKWWSCASAEPPPSAAEWVESRRAFAHVGWCVRRFAG